MKGKRLEMTLMAMESYLEACGASKGRSRDHRRIGGIFYGYKIYESFSLPFQLFYSYRLATAAQS